jgi:hypothetical protein
MLTFCFFFVLTAISLDLVCMRAVEDELIMAALEGNLGRIKGIPASIDSLFLPRVQLLRGCVLACLINGDFDTQAIKKDVLDTQATKKFGWTSKPLSQNFLTPNPFRP